MSWQMICPLRFVCLLLCAFVLDSRKNQFELISIGDFLVRARLQKVTQSFLMSTLKVQ